MSGARRIACALAILLTHLAALRAVPAGAAAGAAPEQPLQIEPLFCIKT